MSVSANAIFGGARGALLLLGAAAAVVSQLVTSATVSTGVNAVNSTTFTATATCPTGKAVLGGGGQVTVNLATQLGRAAIKESYPSDAGQWTVVGVITSTLVDSIASVTAWAVCAA